MRVESVAVYHVPAGYRTAVVVELRCDDGTVGYGEAGVAYGVGGRGTAHVVAQLAEAFVLGHDPLRSAVVTRRMTELSFWGKASGPIITAAVSGLEHALLDLTGKALGVPVHVLLGGAEHDDVPVYANGWWFGCETIDEYADAAARCVADGYDALKFYPLAVPDPDTVIRHPERSHVDRSVVEWGIGCIAAIRDRVGPDVLIMLDLGGGVAADLALRFCRAIEKYDIDYVEEPLDPGVRHTLRRVTAGTTITVAAGERHLTRSGAEALLEDGALLLQPDVANCGGIRELRAIAGLAETRGVRISPHNYGGPVATAAALQVSATLPNLHRLEFFPYFEQEPGYFAMHRGDFTAGSTPSTVALPTAPGLGIDLDETVLRKHLVCRVEGERP